jgi:hypothetical protein
MDSLKEVTRASAGETVKILTGLVLGELLHRLIVAIHVLLGPPETPDKKNSEEKNRIDRKLYRLLTHQFTWNQF